MKKIYILFLALIATASSFAQTVVNGDMELWRTNMAGAAPGTPLPVQAPDLWYGADSLFIALGQSLGSTFLGVPTTVWHNQLFQENTIVHGPTSSAKLVTVAQDTIVFPGILSNAVATVTFSFTPKFALKGITYSGGQPVTVKPTTVSAWVQYAPGMDTNTHTPAVDSGAMTVQALAHIGTVDSIIGTGVANVGATSGSWVQITANVTYPLDNVDSVTLLRITFTSSGGGGTTPTDSSTMYVDDVTMTSEANPIKIDHTGIGLLTANDVVKVYPNPASDVLYMDGPAGAILHCTLFAVNGQVVATKTIMGSSSLDISTLADGLYFYTIANEQGSTLQRGKVSVNK